MEHGVALGRMRGLTVTVHWSVVVIVWLFAWSLASTLPGSAPGYPDAVYWVAGFCGAALFAAGLLAHELAHAVVARRSGIPVPEVTLWLFGGVARLAGEAKTPRDEFRMAAAGPALSLALSAVFAAVAAGLAGTGISPLATEVAAWLAAANAVLAVFNLLPGAPLDGGRILRAYLWHRHGDPVRAAIGAARAGRVVAYLLIGLGLVEFLLGSLIGGAWLAFIG
ncbi:MAG: site-2 protease family protein, partial [Mycolicibacterium sp.]